MLKQLRTIHILYSGTLLLALAACDEDALLTEDFAEQRLEDENAGDLLNPSNPAADFAVCAVMYEHIHFGGDLRDVGEGANISNIGGLWNDQVSSVQVSPGCVLNAYEHINFKGAHKAFLGSVPWVGDGWNDRISSYACTCL